MLTNINTDSPRLPQLLIQENESASNADKPEVLECAPGLCKQPTSRIDLLERLYRLELLPNMKSTDQAFMKVSRRKYDFLENSILATLSEEIFEQYHWRDKKGLCTGIEKKGLLGIGSYKRVWDLKPLHPVSISSQMVRARFHWDKSSSFAERLQKIKEFKIKADQRFLLIPDSILYIKSSGFRAVVQMMPKGFGEDLFRASKKPDRLSYIGQLRAIHSLGMALTDMHEINWVHLDVKPHNVMLMNQDANHPITKLIDFDLAKEFKPDDTSYYCKGTPRYMDPKCIKGDSRGLVDAKIHDQYSFGATFYELVTGHLFRDLTHLEALKAWVQEEELTVSPRFLELNEKVQEIIRKCCLGSPELRPYRLPEFLPILEELINMQTTLVP